MVVQVSSISGHGLYTLGYGKPAPYLSIQMFDIVKASALHDPQCTEVVRGEQYPHWKEPAIFEMPPNLTNAELRVNLFYKANLYGSDTLAGYCAIELAPLIKGEMRERQYTMECNHEVKKLVSAYEEAEQSGTAKPRITLTVRQIPRQ